MVAEAPSSKHELLMPDDMNDGNYGGGPPDAEEPKTTEDNEDQTKSCLIPKSLFKDDPEPGATITLTVESVYSDEVECSVASDKTETEKPQMSPNDELDMMAGENME